MERVRDVFKLKWQSRKSNRSIGQLLSISKSTVATYLSRAARAEMSCLEQLNPEFDSSTCVNPLNSVA